jgi:hypothetical protein
MSTHPSYRPQGERSKSGDIPGTEMGKSMSNVELPPEVAQAVCDPHLSSNTKALLVLLTVHQWRGTGGTQRELARQLGCSLATFKRALSELVRSELVVVVDRYWPSDGGRAASSYQVKGLR